MEVVKLVVPIPAAILRPAKRGMKCMAHSLVDEKNRQELIIGGC